MACFPVNFCVDLYNLGIMNILDNPDRSHRPSTWHSSSFQLLQIAVKCWRLRLHTSQEEKDTNFNGLVLGNSRLNERLWRNTSVSDFLRHRPLYYLSYSRTPTHTPTSKGFFNPPALTVSWVSLSKGYVQKTVNLLKVGLGIPRERKCHAHKHLWVKLTHQNLGWIYQMCWVWS